MFKNKREENGQQKMCNATIVKKKNDKRFKETTLCIVGKYFNWKNTAWDTMDRTARNLISFSFI